MPERVYGSRYNEHLSVTDIAKKTREFIHAETKSKAIPKGLKFSVRTDRGSTSASIDIAITHVPPNIPLYDPKKCFLNNPALEKSPNNFVCGALHPNIQPIVNRIEQFVKSHNFDGSDAQFDYFDVRFYGGDVSVDYRIAKDERMKVYGCLDTKGVYQPSLCKPVLDQLARTPIVPKP